MVAVIKTGHSINRILNYNENKVKEGKAECISAVNYPIDIEKISFNQKLNRLLKLASLNENVTRNSVHISLNFDPSEKLSNEQLKEISNRYMEKIGFGEQPYLVYHHTDAAHPHIHIVSLKVRADGSRIDTNNIGRNQSEKARKEIENDYGLVKAEGMKAKPYELKSAYGQKVQYGRSESRRAIVNVLDNVLNTYRYTSLAELNAVLQQYNVLADRGSEGSRVYKNEGLLYRILDEKGNSVGVPIKASSFHNKPTLKYIEERFNLNEAARQSHKARVKNAIDLAVLKQPKKSLKTLQGSLQKEGIHTVVRQNKEGTIYGLTYVDHKTKCVFNGSDLGKQYSAKGIQERCGQNDHLKQNDGVKNQVTLPHLKNETNSAHKEQFSIEEHLITNDIGRTAEEFLQPIQGNNYLPYQLRKTKKKKRRNISNNQ
ncbi:relaxase/mobilization nuclease domain-containing protein [Segetibacter koreensis]|uniref:relaxase/mobilization nuclease domain-containing protein n=1 Tax=Segetibacter koreensis TaxID=398037 RepID=UPI000363C59E|nr:relaxase/mobilization nuclease domain-containing protein [Segetibacter koreensis]